MFTIYFHITDSLEIYSNNLDKFDSVEHAEIVKNEENDHSPAKLFYENSIDLNLSFNRNPAYTFFARVKNNDFADEGIDENDLLIVDRSIPFTNGKTALCFINGAYLIRRISIELDAIIWLKSLNDAIDPVRVTKDNKSMIWGIVAYIVKTM